MSAFIVLPSHVGRVRINIAADGGKIPLYSGYNVDDISHI